MTKEEKKLAQREQITYWLEYFKNNKMESGDLELEGRLKDFIISMLTMQLDEMGVSIDDVEVDIETDVVGDANGSYFHNKSIKDGEVIKGKSLYEFNLANRLKDFQADDAKIRLSAVRDLSNTIFHESRHHRQYLMVDKNVSSKETIIYARDFFLRECLKGDFYQANYYEYAVEVDARKAAQEQYVDITSDEELSKKNETERNFLTEDSYSYANNNVKRNVLMRAVEDKVIVDGKNVKYLLKYPVFQKYFDANGRRKSCSELIMQMDQEIQQVSECESFNLDEKRSLIREIREMYYELIYQELLFFDDPGKELEQIDKDKGVSLFEDMMNYFSQELDGKLEIVNQNIETKKARDYYKNYKNRSGVIKREIGGEKLEIEFDDFLESLDPLLTQGEYMFSNGNKFNIKQIVKEYFLPYIPESGMVLLSKGTNVAAKDFIEKILISVQQQKLAIEDIVCSIKEIMLPSYREEYKKSQIDGLTGEYNYKLTLLRNCLDRIYLGEKSVQELPQQLEEPSILESAVAATESSTRTSEINHQLEMMMQIEQERDNPDRDVSHQMSGVDR